MKIRIPKEDCYYITPSMAYGPFHDSGEPFDIIDTGDDSGSFNQGAGLFGQNSVSHDKSFGEITINSMISSKDVRPLAGSNTAFQVTFNGNYWYTTYPELLSGGSYAEDNLNSQSGSYFTATKHAVMNDYVFTATASAHIGWNYPANVVLSCNIRQIRPKILLNGSVSTTTAESRVMTVPSTVLRVQHFSEVVAAVRAYTPDLSSSTYQGLWYDETKRKYRDRYQANVTKAVTWYRKVINDSLLRTQALPDVQPIGDLVQAACENVNPNTINALAFIKDLKDVKSLVPKLQQLNRLSTHAGNYLGVEYGVLPTISDLQTIWESFRTKYFYDPHGFQRASAYDTAQLIGDYEFNGMIVTRTTMLDRRIHLAINTGDTGLDALTEKLRKLGVFPSLTNLWDLVPYSFVLDWFVDVGSVLERIDTRHQLFNLDIKYTIQSHKVVTRSSFTSVSNGLFGRVEVSSYDRSVGTSVPQPTIFKENRITAQKHWVEGSALILARKR